LIPQRSFVSLTNSKLISGVYLLVDLLVGRVVYSNPQSADYELLTLCSIISVFGAGNVSLIYV
jgi:hypothetical protein